MFKTLRSLSIVVLFCLGHYAVAQTESGTISGRVVDSSGSAVPNAAVKLSNQATGVDQECHDRNIRRLCVYAGAARRLYGERHRVGVQGLPGKRRDTDCLG